MNNSRREQPARREILAALGTAAAAAPLAAARVPSERIRIGLIGCGGISKANMGAFLAHPECEIVTICDVDDGQLAKTARTLSELGRKQPEAVKDFRRVVERRDVDACVICTPDHWHALALAAACEAGKDAYVEKPLAPSIGESRYMRDIAARTGSICQMGTYWRSGEHYAEAVEYVQSGKLGKVRQVRCWAYLDWVRGVGNPPDGTAPNGVDYDMWLGPAPERPFNPNRFHFNFRWFWDYAGGLMTDWGVHLINIALWAMGPEFPKSVVASGGKYVLQDNTETPDTQTAVFDFPSYTLIWEHQVECGLGPDRRPNGVLFTGTNASLLVHTGGWEVFAEPSKKGVPEFSKTARAKEEIRAAHARDLLDCMRSRKQPVENLEIGHHVTAVAQLGNIALRSKSRVEWDAARQRVRGSEAAMALMDRRYRAPWKLG